jgi:hypothetical protein
MSVFSDRNAQLRLFAFNHKLGNAHPIFAQLTEGAKAVSRACEKLLIT